MKKITKLLTLLAVFAVGFSFTSCSDDNDPVEEVTSDLAKQVVGVYAGEGVMTYLGIEVEKYAGMKIEIRRSSSEYVLLKVLKADNTVLLSDAVLRVLQTASGDYKLNSDEYPSLKVSINKDGSIEYSCAITYGGEDGYNITFKGKLDKGV